MFTKDIVLHAFGPERFTDRQQLWLGRSFVIAVVVVTYLLTLVDWPINIFDLGVWCFSGFGSLFPIVFAAVYWKRATKAGAIFAVAVTALVWIGLLTYDLYYFKPEHPREEFLLWQMMPVTVIFATCLVSLVVVSLLTSPPSPATIRKFFPTNGDPA